MKKLLTLVLLLLLSFTAYADSFVINNIKVDGLDRISKGTVLNYLPVKVGDTYQTKDAADIVNALFSSKFFSDIQVDRQANTLIVKVKERPAISTVTFVGNKDIKSEELRKSLKKVGFAEGEVYQRSMLERVKLELERQYYSRGKYSVKIDSTVKQLPRNRVAITITMEEGQAATIKEINIVGNHDFTDEELLNDFETTTGNWFSSITKNNQYSRQKLSADLERLRSYYLDRGYADFAITSTQVTISDDKKSIYITINLSEGKKYKIDKVSLSGNLVVPEQQLFPLVTFKKNAVFSERAITATTKNITNRLGDEGYAFANINAVPKLDRKNHLVDLTFYIDPGRRAYVRRINISGNSKTRDEVLRREMRQQESSWFSTQRVKESKQHILRLGYFKSVNVETKRIPGVQDQVDLNFKAEESPSGSVKAGVGFSQTEGIIFNADLTQKNFLGSGKYVKLGFSRSSYSTLYSLGFTNPYLTVDGISRGFNLYYRNIDANNANIGSYILNTVGGDVTYGIPISDDNRINLGVGFKHQQVELPADNQISYYQDFIDKEGDTFDTPTLNLGWSSDSRDTALLPNSGVFQTVRAEVAVPSTDLTYYKVRYKANFYRPIVGNWILALRTSLGYGKAYGDTEAYPFFENFYAGGIRNVRGFRANTLGVRENDQPLGGNLLVTGSAEIVIPIPFMLQQPKSFRLTAFTDGGNVYLDGQKFDKDLLRYSAGVGATWISPFGALSFSLATPLKKQPDDEREFFQFSLGSTF